MAVVDGVAGSYLNRLPGYLSETFLGMLWAHMLLVPWIFLTNWFFMKRYGSKTQ